MFQIIKIKILIIHYYITLSNNKDRFDKKSVLPRAFIGCLFFLKFTGVKKYNVAVGVLVSIYRNGTNSQP